MSTRNRQQGRPQRMPTWAEVLARCPYRTLIGRHEDGVAATTPSDLLPRLSHTIALLGGDVEPIASATMAEIVTSIRAGGTVLLVADRADIRDYAKREILAMAGQAGGWG